MIIVCRWGGKREGIDEEREWVVDEREKKTFCRIIEVMSPYDAIKVEKINKKRK